MSYRQVRYRTKEFEEKIIILIINPYSNSKKLKISETI